MLMEMFVSQPVESLVYPLISRLLCLLPTDSSPQIRVVCARLHAPNVTVHAIGRPKDGIIHAHFL